MRLKMLLTTLLVLGGLALAQSAGGTHENDRWGFKVKYPTDFKVAALSASEEWVVAKFISTREVTSKKADKAGFVVSDYPQVWVIGFPHDRQRGAKVKKDGDKTTVTFKNPYKDYKDFVKRERWFVGGGYFFSKEEETTYKDMKVTKYEIKVEKMVSSPFRIVTWVYHFDDIDFAVQCKVLEDYYKKYRSAYNATMKSFRRIARKKAMRTGATTGSSIVTAEDESKLTPEQKAKKRQEKFERTLKRETEVLPKDWYVKRSEHYVVMANCSKKFAKQVLDHAEAIRGYLDKTFGGVGTDYVPPGIIRIFNTKAEREAYQATTSSNWFDWAGQVTLSEESKTLGRKSWAMEPVSDGVTGQWLKFKNRMLRENMPWWFRFGLERHMRFARTKGRHVKIKPDDYDRDVLKQIVKEGKAVEVRKLFEAGDDQRAYEYQCGSVVSYLLTNGNRGKWKGKVVDYMNNLIGAIEEAEKEFKAKRKKLKDTAAEAITKSGPTEETEDESGEDEEDGKEYWEAWAKAAKDKVKAIRRIAFEKTFGKMKDSDWERLHKAWLKHAG